MLGWSDQKVYLCTCSTLLLLFLGLDDGGDAVTMSVSALTRRREISKCLSGCIVFGTTNRAR
jgi:hypothetical protein